MILIPGDLGSRIQAKLDMDNDCYKKSGWYDLWVNVEQLFWHLDCWMQTMSLVYNTSTKTSSNMPGVATRIPGAPPIGNTSDIEYLDSDQQPFSAYYAKLVQKFVSDLNYKPGVNLHGAPYDFRQAANEHETYFKNLTILIQNTYEKVQVYFCS